eukprot:6213055-Pleurochrysis_carterae.AAC.1
MRYRGGCTCLREAPACVPAVHQGGAHTPGRTSGGIGSPMVAALSCARAGSCCRQQLPSGGASRWRSSWLASWSTPSTPRRRSHARASRAGLLQHAHVTLGGVLPRLVLAAVGLVHVELLEHEADLGAVEFDLVVTVERAASKVAAIMVVLVAHKVGAQRGEDLSLDAMKPTSLVRVGQLPATLRSGAFARWCMDAWCIAPKCSVIGQVVWLSMCECG